MRFPKPVLSRNSPLRNKPLLILASGHFTVDMYSGMLPVLFPAFRDQFDLDLGTVGLVALAYTGMASVSQPIFGLIADRWGTRMTGFAQIWTSVFFAILGFVPSFPMLLVFAGLAGIGSGWFHPFGALNAGAVIKPQHRNTAMSMYISGGTIGVALGPLIGAALVSIFGLRGLGFMIIPGTVIGSWLLFAMRDLAVQGRPKLLDGETRVRQIVPFAMIAVVVGVMMLRQIPTIGVESFIPSWYKDLGYSATFYSSLATTVVLATAIGALGVGTLADRYGRRSVMLATMILTVPAVWAFTEFPGKWAFVSGACIGFLAASTSPILLVMAQQLMKGRAGAASGLILGLGFVSGAIATPVFGTIADAHGMQNALRILLGVVVCSIMVAWFLPTEEKISAFVSEPAPVHDARPSKVTT
jgi:FSR family fosmidomycin resistance protein-like MFS transporter